MPPSDLPWWGRLLRTAATCVFATIAYVVAIAEGRRSWLAAIVTLTFGPATVFLAVIGILPFAKWTWNN